MGGVVFGSNTFVTFEPEGHRYTDAHGNDYTSVSKKLNSIEVPFDSKGISLNMAKQRMRSGDTRNVADIQAEILTEWKEKGDSSLEKGNWIHDNLEAFHKLGTCDPKLNSVVTQLRKLYDSYYKVFTEVLLFDSENYVSGQTDLAVQRQRGNGGVFDFYDYKTNQAKGIQYDSINRKKDPWKHYNKYFLPPFEYLEDCNYNRYGMQLSTYARMAQKLYGIKVGKLAIIFIDNNLKVRRIPVHYMKYEADVLLGLQLKPLPA